MKANDRAGVSVVIAVYNGERYLGEAIDSVLAQSVPPLEIVVVDDGSTDGSAAVAERYGAPVRCFARPHEGVGAALNFGVRQTRGDLLAFLDADDLWTPEKLARQLPFLRGPDAPDMVFAHVEPFLSPDVEAGSYAVGPVAPGYLKGTLLMSREAFGRVGEFDTTKTLGDFIEWVLRAREAGLRSALLPDVLLRRRIHDANTVTRNPNAQSDYVRIAKAALDRRRALMAAEAGRQGNSAAEG